MGQPLEKRNEMREIRAAIKTVLLVSPQGLGVRELIPNVQAILPRVATDQIRRQALRMVGGDLVCDLSNPRRAVYYLAGTAIEPPEPAHVRYKPRAPAEPKEIPDLEVIQRTVPAPRAIPVFIKRSPMQWCVDVLAGAM